MFACIHGPLPDLPQIAEAFSPTFEQTDPGTVVFRVDGLKRLYGSLHQIADAIANQADGRANVAIAETADAAILAAHNFSGITVTPKLDHLNVESLPITEELGGIFESWGIRTLAQLAQLPETGIAERFGTAGVYLQRLAQGTINRPLKIFQPEITYEDRIELDHPADLLEPLLFLIARILNDQCEKLLSHAMAASEITIRLELENKTEHVRTLRLPVPMRDSKSLLKLLQMDLEAHPPQSGTTALSVSLKPVNPRTIQSDIFMPATHLELPIDLSDPGRFHDDALVIRAWNVEGRGQPVFVQKIDGPQVGRMSVVDANRDVLLTSSGQLVHLLVLIPLHLDLPKETPFPLHYYSPRGSSAIFKSLRLRLRLRTLPMMFLVCLAIPLRAYKTSSHNTAF
jgi:hypothetical protein